MTTTYSDVSFLRRAIMREMVIATGLPPAGWIQTLLSPLLFAPAHRFSSLIAKADRRVAQDGLAPAARWMMQRFVDDVEIINPEHIPSQGPLVIASNHPGTYDSILIASCLPRNDLKIIVSDIPFLRNLQAAGHHMIYTTHDPHDRMRVFRESTRHLQNGGALLVFASAQVDPDPALLPGAEQALNKWSSSLPLFLRRVPQTQLLVTIVRGVLAPACFYHPLTRIRQEQRLKQFLAEFLQIGQQVLFGRRFGLTPTITFAKAMTGDQLGRRRDDVLAAIINQARTLLDGRPPGNELKQIELPPTR